MAPDDAFSVSPAPSAEEAAAVIAAIERFLADTTSPAAAPVPAVNGWLRAALLEGVGERDDNAVW